MSLSAAIEDFEKETKEYLDENGLSVADYLPKLLSIKDLTDPEEIENVIVQCVYLRQYAEEGLIDFLQPGCLGDARYDALLVKLSGDNAVGQIYALFEELVALREDILQKALLEVRYS